MAAAATPWGKAELVERVTLRQQAGERLVRIAYTTNGSAARRGPVTLRKRDLERLHQALGEHPALAEALGWGDVIELAARRKASGPQTS